VKAVIQILNFANQVLAQEPAGVNCKARLDLAPGEHSNFVEMIPQPDGSVRIRSLRPVTLRLDVSNTFTIEPHKYEGEP
jgi:hypothetical protein